MHRSTVHAVLRQLQWGAAYLAGLAVGYWSSKEEVRHNWSIDQKFYPSITEETREQKIKGWNKAVKYSYGWAKDE